MTSYYERGVSAVFVKTWNFDESRNVLTENIFPYPRMCVVQFCTIYIEKIYLPIFIQERGIYLKPPPSPHPASHYLKGW
jgi:hypothetical protein